MSNFEALFDGSELKEPVAPVEKVEAVAKEPVVAEPKGEPKEPAVEGEAVPAAEGTTEGAPPASGQSKTVPLAALEAERAGRQDWKEKAIRFEERITAMEAAEKARSQQPQGDQQSREPTMAEQLFDQRAHVSEMLVRSKHADVDEKKAAFDLAAKENPSLIAAMLRAQSPWDFVYQEGTKQLALKDFGTDPVAYRKRVEDEIRAQILAESTGSTQAAADAPALNIPQSLAGTRSAAARSSPTHSGPTPLETIFSPR